MSETDPTLEQLTNQDYQYGFVTDIGSDSVPPGLDESVVRLISEKKDEPKWLLDWRLKALARFLELLERNERPSWAMVDYPEIDYQKIIYYSSPKAPTEVESLDEVDPELLRTMTNSEFPSQNRNEFQA